MDPTLRAYYRMAAERDFLKFNRTTFQEWFAGLMTKRYADDYVNVRLSRGDGGLDGYRLSNSTVYQVYAPRGSTASEVVTKFTGDFETAKNHFEEKGLQMSGWTFVHNDPDDLPHEVVLKFAELKKENSGVEIRRWSFEAIWNELEQLSQSNLEDLFGQGPTSEMLQKLELPAIQQVVEYLNKEEVPLGTQEIEFPSPEKLEYNQLPREDADILKAGRSRQALVGQYFSGAPDPELGEKIAQAFRNRYATLRDSGASASQVFDGLWQFAGGEHFAGQRNSLAALIAVLAYFFDSCDIFENVPEE